MFNAINEYDVLFTFEDKIGEFSYQDSIPPGKALIWKDMANSKIGIGKKPSHPFDSSGGIHTDSYLAVDDYAEIDGNVEIHSDLKVGGNMNGSNLYINGTKVIWYE